MSHICRGCTWETGTDSSTAASPQSIIYEPLVGDKSWEIGCTWEERRAEEVFLVVLFPFNFIFWIEEIWALLPGHRGDNLIEDTRERQQALVVLPWSEGFSYHYKKKIMWKYWRLKVNIVLLNRFYGCGLRKVYFSQSIIMVREMAINLSLYIHTNVKFYHIFM